MSDPATVDSLRELGPSLAARSAEFEQLRQLPPDVVDSLHDSGVLRSWIPKSLGGHQLDVQAGLGLIEELGYWDSAVGWCTMIWMTTSVQSAFLPKEVAQRIYGDHQRVVTSGTAEPRGVAKVVDGGIEVAGEWSWGSGSFAADWIGVGCRIEDQQVPGFVFLERDQVELLDTWHVSGLKGTGSTDYRVDSAYVPEGQWVYLGPGQRSSEAGAFYRFPGFGLLALGVTAVAFGVARRALDEFRQIADAKRYVGSGKTLANRPGVQAGVAEAEARLLAAQSFVEQAVAQASEQFSIDAEGAAAIECKRRIRLAATHGMRAALDMVDVMFQLAGGTAVYERCPLQRLSRDIHVAATHGMVAPRTYELTGRLALGLETNTAQL